MYCSKAQHGALSKYTGEQSPCTKGLNDFVMFVLGMGEDFLQPLMEKKKKKQSHEPKPPQTPRNKKTPTGKPPKATTVLGPKILHIQSLNLVGCFVQF